MKKTCLLLCFFGFFLSGFTQNKSSQLDSLFASLHKEKKFFGNVLIAEKGKVIYQASFGKANIATGEDLNAESLFELASVSKQFTAMGIMLLKKQGKLSYEDSLRHFFPELPYSGISVRQLMQHTSGLPDYMDLMMNNCDAAKIGTNADMIRLLAVNKPAIVFKPGEKWEYSNTGYALLASIIEKVSGSSFPEYLAKNIFQPLSMKRTMIFRRRFEKRKEDNYAYGYGLDKKKNEYVLPDDDTAIAKMVRCLDGVMGDGTVNSTTNDLFLWDQTLYTEKLVSKEMMQEAFTSGLWPDGKPYNYGYGWFTGKLEKIGQIVNHAGGWPGYMTYIERHLETGNTIILLRNYEQPGLPVQKIRNIIYGYKEEIRKEVKLGNQSLKQYTGEYELAPGFIITISVEGERIFAQATGQEKFELFAEKEDYFFLKAVDATVKFNKGENKTVHSLTLRQNGQDTNGKKIK